MIYCNIFTLGPSCHLVLCFPRVSWHWWQDITTCLHLLGPDVISSPFHGHQTCCPVIERSSYMHISWEYHPIGIIQRIYIGIIVSSYWILLDLVGYLKHLEASKGIDHGFFYTSLMSMRRHVDLCGLLGWGTAGPGRWFHEAQGRRQGWWFCDPIWLLSWWWLEHDWIIFPYVGIIIPIN